MEQKIKTLEATISELSGEIVVLKNENAALKKDAKAEKLKTKLPLEPCPECERLKEEIAKLEGLEDCGKQVEGRKAEIEQLQKKAKR